MEGAEYKPPREFQGAEDSLERHTRRASIPSLHRELQDVAGCRCTTTVAAKSTTWWSIFYSSAK